MSKIDPIWEELNILEHREEALEWAEIAFPQYSGNESLIAQLYYSSAMEKSLPPPVDIITVGDLKEKFADFTPEMKPDGKETKLYATIEVVMVQMLDDSRGYFGCPHCYNKVDKNVGICMNMDPENGHPGEEYKGTSLTFQKWQAGDNTGSIIVTFGPSSHQELHDTQFYTLTIRGSMNNRDGSFNAWEVINKKSPKGLKGLKKLEGKKKEKETKLEPEHKLEEVIVDDEKSDEEPFEETEESVDNIFGDEGEAGEGEFTFEGLTEEENANLTRDFKNILKKHYTAKPNAFKNVIRWMVVQPQFRKWTKGEERDAVVRSFLEQARKSGLYDFVDEEETEVISKL